MAIIDTYEPINTLKPVVEGLWIVDGPIIEFGYLGTHIPFPTRMTIARLDDGSLWIHSPTELTASLKAQVDAMGPVRYLIAPNRIHYWWVGQWKSGYPEAIAFAAPRVRERAKPHAIVFDRDLSESSAPEWAGQIDQILVRGGYLSEFVFFHRRSRTLILTDLIQNFETEKIHSALWGFLMRATGCADPDGKVPIDLRLTFLGYRSAMRSAVKEMISWQPERVILAHGRWYEKDGVRELKRAFRWLGSFEDERPR
jgi:Domain of unknown function (DUF4336)